MPKHVTITLTVNASTARMLQRLQKNDGARAPMRGGWTTTRGVAQRMHLTSGGTNGRPTRAGLQLIDADGRYCITKLARELGLGRQEQGGHVEWRVKQLIEWLEKQPYHGPRR